MPNPPASGPVASPAPSSSSSSAALAALLCLTLLPPALGGNAAAAASPGVAALDPAQQCRAAIQMAERAHRLPPQLLHAIARVESGRRDPASGQVTAWPWTINAEGQGRFFATREEAIAEVRQLQARGVRLIDVGCMQINLHHHPNAFASLEEAFDPVANARYAARFLADLYASRRDWTQAAANYHSNTPERAEAYRARVLAAWPAEQRRPYTIRDEMALAWAQHSARGGRGRGGMQSALGQVATGAAAHRYVAGQESRGAAAAATNGFAAVALSLSNRADRARVLPLARGGAGRGLEAYRAAPITIAGRRVHVVQMAEAPSGGVRR